MKNTTLSVCVNVHKIDKLRKREKRDYKILTQLNKQFKELDCPECQKKMRWIYISKHKTVYLRCECKCDVVLWKYPFSKWKVRKSGKEVGLNINRTGYKHTIDIYKLNADQ